MRKSTQMTSDVWQIRSRGRYVIVGALIFAVSNVILAFLVAWPIYIWGEVCLLGSISFIEWGIFPLKINETQFINTVYSTKSLHVGRYFLCYMVMIIFLMLLWGTGSLLFFNGSLSRIFATMAFSNLMWFIPLCFFIEFLIAYYFLGLGYVLTGGLRATKEILRQVREATSDI